jgi:metal-responsive CopG/Arc/MetJ family transcriptional regulator
MPGKKPLVRVTISLDAGDYADLGGLSEESDVSRSRLIRQAIRQFLDDYRNKGKLELALTCPAKGDR